jgi:Ca2+-binding RTX toxin-like protein
MTDVAATTTLAADGTTVVNVEEITFYAGNGDDTITTLGGEDFLFGGKGDDRLTGGGGEPSAGP